MKKLLVITNNNFDKQTEDKLKSNELSFDYITPSEIDSADLSVYEGVIFCAYYISEDILKRLSNVKLMSFLGVGYSSFIDTDFCNNNGIKIANTPGVNADAVAEFSIGLLLDLTRGITNTNSQFKAGNNTPEIKKGREINTSTIGIAGFGDIGAKIASICSKGFGSKVIYTSRSDKNNAYEYVSKEELLKQSDILFLAMDENPTTVDYISAKELEMMKETAFIINPSRPHIVNGPDLYDALKDKKIAGYAVDGYYSKIPRCDEDKIDHNLLTLPDTVYINSPHIAYITAEAAAETVKVATDNVINFFNEELDKVKFVN